MMKSLRVLSCTISGNFSATSNIIWLLLKNLILPFMHCHKYRHLSCHVTSQFRAGSNSDQRRCRLCLEVMCFPLSVQFMTWFHKFSPCQIFNFMYKSVSNRHYLNQSCNSYGTVLFAYRLTLQQCKIQLIVLLLVVVLKDSYCCY